MRPHRRLAVILTFVAAVAVAPITRANDDRVPDFLKWCDAVIDHAPGKSDAALETVWAMVPADRLVLDKFLNDYLQVFAVQAIVSPLTLGSMHGGVFDHIDRRVALAAGAAKERMSMRTFLERSAMFHADAVMFEVPVTNARPAVGLTSGAHVGGILVSDGEVTGVVDANWNWQFARTLLGRLKPLGAEDPFIAAWYHGTATYLLRQRDFAEAVWHLDHAADLLPEDARILFDRGTVYETLAMNLIQQASEEPRSRPRPSPRAVTLPDPAAVNEKARHLYERAIAANPGLIEAHVRLARELELAGDFAGATREVAIALKLDPAVDVAFYAHLFGARAANALGLADAAESHITAALALYPNADSAWLAASQTALQRADPGTAIERLGKLETPTRTALDPWPRYALGAGRLAEIALTELWGLVPAYAAR